MWDTCLPVLADIARCGEGFKEDPIPAIEKWCRHHGTRFVDVEFPPGPESFGAPRDWDASKIKWTRLPELHQTTAQDSYHLPKQRRPRGNNSCRSSTSPATLKEPSVRIFDTEGCGVHYKHVMQGDGFGDCWLLALFAAAAYDQPETVRHMLQPKALSLDVGAYSCRLWSPSNQAWTYVLIDDFLPVGSNGKPFSASFGCSGHAGKLNMIAWVILLEKVFAKLEGSYASIEGGEKNPGEATSSHHCLSQILGGKPGYITWQDKKVRASLQSGGLWKQLQMLRKKGKSISLQSAGAGEEVTPDSMVTGHAYTLLDMADIDKFRLLKIRNIWGKKSWTGPWGVGSDEWTKHPKIARALRVEDQQWFKDDGIFWMAYEDFLEQFVIANHN